MTTPTRKRLGDRRSRPRFDVVGNMWGSLEAIEPLDLVNLGEGGALLETRFALKVDTVHRVRFTSEEEVTDVQARVRHVTRLAGAPLPRCLIGLEFQALPPAAADHLGRILAANTDGTAAGPADEGRRSDEGAGE